LGAERHARLTRPFLRSVSVRHGAITGPLWATDRPATAPVGAREGAGRREMPHPSGATTIGGVRPQLTDLDGAAAAYADDRRGAGLVPAPAAHRGDPGSCRPSQPTHQTRGLRYLGHGRGGAAAAADPHPRATPAVVARPPHAGPRRPLAGVRPSIRLGAPRPLLQADPQLDPPTRRPLEQADRRTWLVLLAYTQLRLARRTSENRRLP
jgi:hypothetical protein